MRSGSPTHPFIDAHALKYLFVSFTIPEGIGKERGPSSLGSERAAACKDRIECHRVNKPVTVQFIEVDATANKEMW